MAVDTREASRSYQVPDVANLVSEEFPRLKLAITSIGTDVAGLLTSVAGKAPTVHTHTIANVSGLQAALDAKENVGGGVSIGLDDLSDVNLTGAANFQVLARISGVWVPWTFDVTYANGWASRLASSTLDAGQITSGTLDPARIPVLASQNTIVSSGAIANLTSPQQATISTGTHVTTTDGRRWIYSGSGTKTLEASYIELADVTPDWTVVASKPTNVTNFAALSAASQGVPYFTGSGSAQGVQAATSFGRGILNAADAAALRALAGAATVANIRGGTVAALLENDDVWSAGAEVALGALSGSQTLTMTGFLNATITPGGNLTLNNVTTGIPGRSGVIRILPSADITLTWGSGWKFPYGIKPTGALSGSLNSISYYTVSATEIWATWGDSFA